MPAKKTNIGALQVAKVTVVRAGASRRLQLWLAVLIIGAVALAFVVHTVSAPVHGRPSHSVYKFVNKSKPKGTPIIPASEIQTAYFDLPLPAGYRQQSVNSVPNLLYSQTVVKTSLSGSIIINIGLKQLPNGGLEGDTNYRLRMEQSGHYKLENQNIKGDRVVTANDNQSAAVAVFWPHGNYLATISASSGLDNPVSDGNAQELAALWPLLQAWQWR